MAPLLCSLAILLSTGAAGGFAADPREHMARIEAEIDAALESEAPQAPMHLQPCVGGLAGGAYPCNGIDLLEFMPLATFGASSANSGWGWTDTLGTPGADDDREYYLLGLNNGTAFIDITDPENAVYVGKLPSHNNSTSLWRDVRVYQNHAYVVSEASGHGMQVFDLTELRNVATPPVVFAETAHYDKVSNTHSLSIDEATGYAYLVGTSSGSPPVVTCSGGMHIVNLAAPASPAFVGCYNDGIYIHENQCFVYDGPDDIYDGHEICLAARIYHDDFAVLDVTNHAAPVLLDTIRYQPIGVSSYPHQAWFSGDHRFILLDDEGDENSANPTRTWIFDAADLDNLVTAGSNGSFVHATEANDHNLYVRGEYVTQSNYRAGLRILQLTDPAAAQLTEVAYFDVYPANNDRGYNGTWNHYPFFASNVIPVTHIEQGLFLVRPTELCFVPPEEPTGLTATPDGDHRIVLDWAGTGEAGATFEVQRAAGGCGGAFATLASGLTESAIEDSSASGEVLYGYRVREVREGETCFSGYSACVEAQATGTCNQAPAFPGLASAVDGNRSACSAELAWTGATPFCGETTTYSVYRGSAPDFAPSPVNRIAVGIQGLAYTDPTPASQVASYYVVRAVDGGNGAEDANDVHRTVTAHGPLADGTFATGAEVGDPPLDSSPFSSPSSPEHAGWHISEDYWHGGSQSFYSTYSDNLCVSLELGPVALTAGQASQLSFWTDWGIETGSDGGVVEISTNAGGSWSQLTPAPGYPGAFNNGSDACGYATGTPSFTGSNGAWSQRTVNLAGYAGQSVSLAWRFSTDGLTTDEGWYIDDVALTHAQVPGACTANAIFIERHEGGAFGAWTIVAP